MSYDSVCMNDQCIRKKASFFCFDVESEHFANGHSVKSLHPLTFATFFQKEGKNDQNINVQKLSAELKKHRDDTFQNIVEAIRSLFYDDKVIPSFEATIPLCQNISIKSIITTLRQGNFALLQHIKLFQLQKKERNFSNFMAKTIKQMQQQIKNHFTSLKTAILDVCSNLKITQQPKKVRKQNEVIPTPMTIQRSTSENISNSLSQKPPVPFIPSVQKILVKEQYIPKAYSLPEPLEKWEKQEPMDDQQNEEDDESEGQQENHENADKDKNKLIHKQSKRSRKRRKKYNFIDGIEIISQQEVIVKQSRYPLKTLTFLQEKYPLMTTIHIFHQTVASKQAIKRILQTFPRIKKITINCYYEFQPQILIQVSQKVLSQLQMELKWDMSKFFTEYFAYCYFPVKTIKRRERKKPTDIDDISKLLPHNNSVWAYDQSSHQKLDTLTINFDNITALHYENTQPLSYYTRLFSPKLHNIETLVLKNIMITSFSPNNNFNELINNNKLIKTIIISDCAVNNDCIDTMLIKMKDLQYLSKLSLSITDNSRTINAELIFNLVNLTHLNIDRYIFANAQSEWSSAHMKNIFKLNKLQYLSLTGCNVSSDLLGYLSINCLNSLTFLNLGKTNMTKDACQFIKKIPKLQYLNIDCTCIGGDSLVDVFRSMARLSIIDVPLKYLSIQNERDTLDTFSIENMRQIARYVPKLAYLNIAYRKNLANYGFDDFKNLKTLAVDKEQYEKMQDIISHQINRYRIESQEKKQWRYNSSVF